MKTAKANKLEAVSVSTDLAPADRAELVLKAKDTERHLRELVQSTAAIGEPTNDAGRQEVHAAYMTLKNARVAVENTGKAAREDATAFSKAVIAEEKKLVAIVTDEEARLKALRDKWDAAREAERQALIEAERRRVDAIRERIKRFQVVHFELNGKPSHEIQAALSDLALEPLDTFDEFTEEAVTAHRIAVGNVESLLRSTVDREAAEAAVAAEAARLAEQRKKLDEEAAAIAAEREKLDAERRRLESLAEPPCPVPAPDDCQEDYTGVDNFGGPTYSAAITESLAEVDRVVDDIFDSLTGLEEAEQLDPLTTDAPADPLVEAAINEGMTVDEVAEAIAEHIRPGYLLTLSIEHGAAVVSLLDEDDANVELPDTADKTLAEQLNDALAASWSDGVVS